MEATKKIAEQSLLTPTAPIIESVGSVQPGATSGPPAPHLSETDEYREVVAQFRVLTDIRFKLLALLPVGTVATFLLTKDQSKLVSEPAVAVFAFIVTLCIATYNKRNDQHYDELVSRAAELERSAGLVHGAFAQRPRSWLRYGPMRVEHRWPIGLVYASTAALWAYLFAHAVFPRWRLPGWAHVSGTLLAPALVICVWWLLRQREEARATRLRKAVVSLRDQFTKLSRGTSVHDMAVEIAKQKELLGCDLETAERRLRYHLPIGSIGAPQISDDFRDSLVLGAVIDLPARWILDVWTGRR